MVALKTYNSLPKELKSLYSNKNNRKYTLKNKLKSLGGDYPVYNKVPAHIRIVSKRSRWVEFSVKEKEHKRR